jgi:hypothetical protein
MQAIIGASLRERYEAPEQLPPTVTRLLEALDDNDG